MKIDNTGSGSSGALTSPLTLDGTTINVNATEWNYVDGVTSSIQEQLNARPSAALLTKNVLYYSKTPNANAYNAVGIGAATIEGTQSSISTTAGGEFGNFLTAGTTGSRGGIYSPNGFYRVQNPDGYLRVYVPAQSVYRVFAGFSSSAVTVVGSDDPAVHGACFIFNPASHTNWQAFTNDNSGGGSTTDSGVAFAADTAFEFRIRTSASDVKFYIDGSLVATHSSNLPNSTQTMLFGVGLATLENVAKNIRVGAKLGVIMD